MATGRKYVGFNVDTSGADASMAFLEQIALNMKTPAHIGSVLKYAHAVLSQEFDLHMSALAPAAPSRFHHIYEWNQIGVPQGQLWKNVLRGGGNNRVATFEWRASKTIVPVRDPLPQPIGRNGEPREGENDKGPLPIHVFVWKAPMMEYGTSVEVGPKRGKFIVYYTGPTSDPEGPMYNQIRFSTTPITVKNPGGKQVVGAFTREYVAWWSAGPANRLLNGQVKNHLERSTTSALREQLIQIGQRSRQKSMRLSVMSDTRQAKAAGKRAARTAMEKLEANYIQQAIARERFISPL